MFERMNEGYTGQRFQRRENRVERGADGRYREVEVAGRHVSSFLPHVQVSICDPCNTGWMSRMEDDAKAILDPMIRGQSRVVGRDEQRLLAAWVAKFAFSYICEVDPQNIPFFTEEYHALRETLRPPGRARIWMGHSTGPQAWISADVKSYLATPVSSTAGLDSPATAANGFVAAHSVVLIGHWLPDENPDAHATWRDELFTDPWRAGLRRIYPYEADIEWPTDDIPEDRLNDQIWFMHQLFEMMALPFVGRTDEEVEQLRTEYFADGDPAEQRERWGRSES